MGAIQSAAVGLVAERHPGAWAVGWDSRLLAPVYTVSCAEDELFIPLLNIMRIFSQVLGVFFFLMKIHEEFGVSSSN